MKIAFFTLGCKVNQYETQLLVDLFADSGYEIVSCFNFADIYVINSCTVTANSDVKIRRLVSRFKRINSAAVLVLVGCFAQAFINDFERFCGFDVVAGNSSKFNLPKLLNEFFESGKQVVLIEPHDRDRPFPKITIGKFFHEFRAFVKIEDGCNRSCSYCIIPRARGYVKSKPLEVLKLEVEKLSSNFYSEIVLVGINVSSYGFDLENGVRLIDAVDVASGVEKIKRIRLGSLEPDLLSESDVLRLAENKKFCPNFHLALQSGSDSVLKRMGRRYSIENYKNLVDLIFRVFENPSITTDVMVGFPQETESEFFQTLKFIEEIGFLKVHIFPYSARPKTIAAKMSGQIKENEKKIRVNEAKKSAALASRKFLESQIGKILNVLFEKGEGNGVFVGHAKNYVLVRVKSCVNLSGRTEMVKIERVFEGYCFGVVLKF